MIKKNLLLTLLFLLFVLTSQTSNKEEDMTGISKFELTLDSILENKLFYSLLNNQEIKFDSTTINVLRNLKISDPKPGSLAFTIQQNQAELSSYNNDYKWWSLWGIPLLGLIPLMFTLYQWKKSQDKLEKSENSRIIEVKKQEVENKLNQYNQKVKDDQNTIEEILKYCSSTSGLSANATYLAMKFQNCIDYDQLPENYKIYENYSKRVLINFFVSDASFENINHLTLHKELLSNMPRMKESFKSITNGEATLLFQRYQKAITGIIHSDISHYYEDLIKYRKGESKDVNTKDLENPNLVLIAELIIENLKLLHILLQEHEFKNGINNLTNLAYGNNDFFIHLIECN